MLDTNSFLLKFKNNNYNKSFELIKQAYEFSKANHEGQFRDGGDDY